MVGQAYGEITGVLDRKNTSPTKMPRYQSRAGLLIYLYYNDRTLEYKQRP
jgi:hypothetical protein